MREKISRFRRFINSYNFAENKVLLATSILVLLSVPLAVIVALKQVRYSPRAELSTRSTLGFNFGSAAVLSAQNGSYIEVNNTSDYDEFENFTIEAYVKWQQNDNTGSYPILSKGFNPPNEQFTYFLEITPEGKLKFTYSIMYNGRWAPTEIVSDRRIEPNIWTHVAVVYRAVDNLIRTQDDGTIRLYINGAKDKEEVVYADESKKIGGSSDNNIFIGMGPTGNEHFNGALDEVNLSSYPKYSGESFTPPGPLSVNSNTLLLFKFDQTEGNPVGKSGSGDLTTTSNAISYIVHPAQEETTPAPAQEKAVLRINPESGGHALGSNIDALVLLDANGFSVDGVSVVIEYDKQKLQAVSVNHENLNVFNNYIKEEIDEDAGRIRIDAVVEEGNPIRINSAPIEAIRFKAIGEGDAQVRIVCAPLNSSDQTICDQDSVAGSLVSEYGVEGGSILTNVVNSSFRITGPPTPAPTLAITPPLTPTTAPSPQPVGGFGKAIRLDFQLGEPIEYVQIHESSSLLMPPYFTVEAWIKPSISSLDDSNPHYIIAREISDGKPAEYSLALANKRVEFGIYFSSPPNDTRLPPIRKILVSQTELEPNVWYHIKGIRIHGSFYLVINDTIEATESVGLTGYYDNPSSRVTVGCAIAQELDQCMGQFYGEIDELRISKTYRTENDYQTPFGVDNLTVALYHFNGDAQDASGNLNHGQIIGDVEFVDSTISPFMPGITLSPSPRPSEPPTISMARFRFNLEACVKPGADLSRNARVWIGNNTNYTTLRMSSLGVTQPLPIGLKEFDLKVQPEGYLPKIFRGLSGLNLDNGVIDLSDQPISAGDVDGSGRVNIFDYLRFVDEYGTSAKSSDFDCSGEVNILDYSSIISNWNKEISD